MAITNPEADSIGQQCATLKVDGDETPSDIFFAVRTTQPYETDEGPEIRAGTNAVFHKRMPNIARQYCLATGLEPGITHYWAACLGDINEHDIVALSVSGGGKVDKGAIALWDRVTDSSVTFITHVAAMARAMGQPDDPGAHSRAVAAAARARRSVGVMAIDDSVITGTFTTAAPPADETGGIVPAGFVQL